MKLKWLKLPEKKGRCIATIQKSGRMGISLEAVKLLKMEENSYWAFAFDEEEACNNYSILYLREASSAWSDAFKAMKAGRFFYFKTKQLFNSLNIDYSSKPITYRIGQTNYYDEKVYKLIKC